MFDDFISVLSSIGKAQIILLGSILASFIIEKISGLRLFIDHYSKWTKSPRNVEIVTHRDTVYYFILVGAVFVYDIYQENVDLNLFTCISALVIIVILSSIFAKIHKKYQKVDPNKKDDDYI